jgi:hypothetical protein
VAGGGRLSIETQKQQQCGMPVIRNFLIVAGIATLVAVSLGSLASAMMAGYPPSNKISRGLLPANPGATEVATLCAFRRRNPASRPSGTGASRRRAISELAEPATSRLMLPHACTKTNKSHHRMRSWIRHERSGRAA